MPKNGCLGYLHVQISSKKNLLYKPQYKEIIL